MSLLAVIEPKTGKVPATDEVKNCLAYTKPLQLIAPLAVMSPVIVCLSGPALPRTVSA